MTGPQFFQTGYGRRFFDAQLPQLIKNLGRIADALEAKPEVTVTSEPPKEPAARESTVIAMHKAYLLGHSDGLTDEHCTHDEMEETFGKILDDTHG
jgi:hypothetical protein